MLDSLPSAAELTYFLEVANTSNLSRAAEKLGISQPSLSLAIKRLEQSMSAPLFNRHKQGVTLTQAGKQLALHARQLLQHWQQTKTQALDAMQTMQGYVTLGCHSTIAIYLMSHVLPDLLNRYPKLEIHLKHDISRRIINQIVNLSVDLGIIVNPLRHPDLIIRKLCQDEMTFWVGPGNKPIQQINHEKAVIICEPDLIQTHSLLKKCKQAGIRTDRIMTSNSLEVIANLTANGCGIGILPACVAKAMYPKQLKRVPNAPTYADEVCLVYRHENRNVQAIQGIAAAIKQYYERAN